MSTWHAGQLRTQGMAPGIDIGASDGGNIALVHYDVRDYTSEEVRAHARLIAAAPELLATLETVLTDYIHERDFDLECFTDANGNFADDQYGRDDADRIRELDALIEHLQAVIAKARGD